MSAPAAVRRRLEQIWSDDPGAPGFFNTVDHKRIGHRYLVTAFVFFFFGGVQGMIIRAQLVGPDAGVVSPEVYNQIFTMHGTTMIFLFNTPVLSAFGNYLVPLQIGARDMAFPRMNALSYWIYVLSGIFIYSSYFVGQIPDAGWFAYVPLSGPAYSPDLGLDFWAIGIVFLGISTTVGGINFIVTIFKLRAPGMSISRLPLFCWAMLVTSFVIVFALPAITLSPTLLELDRMLGTAFFDPARGGDAVLYQHLFWFWGHPEVYILFIPATGMISMIIPAMARRRIAGYTWAVASLVAIGFISFGVWVHHMFATGLPDLANAFFSGAGLVITFPSAVQIFVWIATLWTGRPRWNATPMLFSLGFILIFVLGGITGVMVSMVPFDWQATDSYFVVAHLHYVLVGGVVFPIFAAMYFWLPKMLGWRLRETWGRWSFWLMFVGFNVTFFPQHIVGLLGMPRRVFTYPADAGWTIYNQISSIGAVVFALGILVSALNLAVSWRRKQPAGANPWGAESLEWAVASPPPDYNFAAIPVVRSLTPLWRQGTGVHTDPEPVATDEVVRLDPGDEAEHETLQTGGLAARLGPRLEMPSPSYWPFLLALAMTVFFSAVLVRSLLLGAVGTAAMTWALVGWHWSELREHFGQASP